MIIQLRAYIGQIWLDNVDCSSGDEILEDCDFNDWGINNCHHYDDVGVVCRPSEYSYLLTKHLIHNMILCLDELFPPVENVTVTYAGPNSISLRWKVSITTNMPI